MGLAPPASAVKVTVPAPAPVMGATGVNNALLSVAVNWTFELTVVAPGAETARVVGAAVGL
jgi:hypothetical protein